MMRVNRATQFHREPVAYAFTPRPSYARTYDVVNACTEVFRNWYLDTVIQLPARSALVPRRRVPWTSRPSRLNVQFRQTTTLPLPPSLSSMSIVRDRWFLRSALWEFLSRSHPSIADRGSRKIVAGFFILRFKSDTTQKTWFSNYYYE